MDPLEDQQSLYQTFQLNRNFDVKIHKNGVILLFISQQSEITSIQFDENIINQLSQLSGRKKHGATIITESDAFATVSLNNESAIQIKSPIRAKLLEINLKQQKIIVKGDLLAIYQPKWDVMLTLKSLFEKLKQGEKLSDEELQQWGKLVMV